MQQGQPSRTAWGVARRRAAHQLLDQRPFVLDDPIALPILGPGAEASILSETDKQQHPFGRAMRSFMVARSRYAEDQLAAAVSRGVRQYVVLGAGLDTFAYRNPFPEVRVFEVDFPATQLWKRQLLAEAKIPLPAALTFVPVDFEQQTLSAAFTESSFDLTQPAFCSWLGVTPYLTLEAFQATIRSIGALPEGSGITFEYALNREQLTPHEAAAFDALADRVKAAGEPFQLSFSPEQMQEELKSAGFRTVEELTTQQINERYFTQRADGLGLRGGVARLITAWR